MDKRFEMLISNAKNNHYCCYNAKIKDGTDCLLIVRQETGVMFAYIIENDQIEKVGECRFIIRKSHRTLRVDLLRVRKDLRSNGIGSKLLECLADFAQSVDCEKIFLISSISATGFYEKIGYERISSADDVRNLIYIKRIESQKFNTDDLTNG